MSDNSDLLNLFDNASSSGSSGAGSISSEATSSLSSALPLAGAALSIITQLFQGHEIRAKGAATENAAMNQIVPYVTQSFLQLVQGMKQGSYTAAQVNSIVGNILSSYNSFVKSLQGKPGIADNGNPPGGICGKLCTVGCCLRGAYVHVLAHQVMSAVQGAPTPTGSTTGHWNLGTTGIPADKYGFAGVAAYSIPIIFVPGGSISSVETGITSSLSSVTASLQKITGGSSKELLALSGLALCVLTAYSLFSRK